MVTLAFGTDATWSDLKHEISQKTGVADFDLKYGYPPQQLNTESIDGDVKLTDMPHKLNGEQLTVVPRTSMSAKLSSPLGGTTRGTQAIPTLPPTKVTAPSPSSEYPATPLNLTRKPKPSLENEPPEVPIPSLEGIMVLRVMPDDNSCLFRALSTAVLGAALDGMTELRSIVAQTIIGNPELYTAGVLEKSPEDYCRWIQREDSWGGGIELAILSQHFDVEVCSVNVQDLRVDRFNEGKGRARVIVVYSGIHYDVCAVTPFRGADPELDRKVFEVVRMGGEGGDEEVEEFDGGALAGALDLCRALQKQHYYTDTHGFALKCNQCGEQGNGQQWAVQHARTSGHGDFGEAD
ncbi:OTU-domain-containing protein [Dissoconium aciculare CBS 342.82]|uniref:Ubiquitin thioesterase OTU n=1 Tax=Dissoconium aciculare CBS 342.82 TaxID=1314786 RepID=A0A6J3LTX5_9PEZI|nr:OTU-domain-containing protein [Dissoconium aciculare CBS 342.82]KAF1818729.1 OTU-domain-containing protein [Dissoconium aciculare CBS 342.82]